MPKQPSANALFDAPLPGKKDEKAKSGGDDADPLDPEEVDISSSHRHYTEEDLDLAPVVPEIGDDDEMLMIDDEIEDPVEEPMLDLNEDIEDDFFLQLETDQPPIDDYIEAEDDYFLQDDEAAFAQLDDAMANED